MGRFRKAQYGKMDEVKTLADKVGGFVEWKKTKKTPVYTPGYWMIGFFDTDIGVDLLAELSSRFDQIKFKTSKRSVAVLATTLLLNARRSRFLECYKALDDGSLAQDVASVEKKARYGFNDDEIQKIDLDARNRANDVVPMWKMS
jgi:hypothetical protein